MSTVAVPVTTTSEQSAAQRIVLAGAVVALLEIAYVFVYFRVTQGAVPLQALFQAVASGVQGPAAFQGGTQSAVLGASLHLLISFACAAVFYFVVRNVGALGRALRSQAGAIGVGLAAGAVAWLVMDFAILPLSRAGNTSPATAKFWTDLVQHAVLVGLPLAFILRDGGEQR